MQIQILDDGALRFLRPDGGSFDSIAPGHSQPFGDWRELPAHNVRSRIQIDAQTAVTQWRGESMDYGLGVEVLLQEFDRLSGRELICGRALVCISEVR